MRGASFYNAPKDSEASSFLKFACQCDQLISGRETSTIPLQQCREYDECIIERKKSAHGVRAGFSNVQSHQLLSSLSLKAEGSLMERRNDAGPSVENTKVSKLLI